MLSVIFAQTENIALPSLNHLTGIEFLQELTTVLIGIGFIAGVVIFLFILLLGAIAWMNAGSDKQKITEARERVTNAIVGLFVLFIFFMITSTVGCAFGISFEQINIGFYEISFIENPLCAPEAENESEAGNFPTVAPPITDDPTPISTIVNSPTPTSSTQSCICQGGAITEDSCNSPYSPYCVDDETCACVIR